MCSKLTFRVYGTTNSAQNAEANKSDNRNNSDKNKKNNGKPFTVNKFTPKGKSVGFSDSHQGNRKWVMPVGAAFFTGTNSVGGSAATVTANAAGKTVIAAPTAKAPVVNTEPAMPRSLGKRISIS